MIIAVVGRIGGGMSLRASYIASLLMCVLLLSGCLCYRINEQVNPPTTTLKSKPVVKPTTSTMKSTTTSTSSTTSTLPAVTRVITQIVYRYQNITLDLTGEQENSLLNMNGGKLGCTTVGCSHGASLCKDYVLDVLGLKTSKFSERPSTGFDPFSVNEVFIPVRDDGRGEYIELDNRVWYVSTNNTRLVLRRRF